MIKKLIIFWVLISLAGCNESTTAAPQAQESASPSDPPAAVDTGEEDHDPLDEERVNSRLSLDQIQNDLDIPGLSNQWTGDLDVMVQKRMVRVLTVYGLGRYFVEDGQEKGITYELFKLLEDALNKRYQKKHIRIHVVFIPVARDELIPALIEGRGDIAAAGLTMTRERDELIDFTDPVTRELSEILVTGPGAPAIESIEDLSGREVYVRASSSYRSSLDTVNSRFVGMGLEPVGIREISEFLEDEDLLEMVNSGALEWAIVDDYKARNWTGAFENLVVREDIVFRSGGQIAFAIREESPQLLAFLNEFVKGHRQGTLKGNILINRWFRDFDWTKNALGADDYERFLNVVNIFEKYGDQYGIDYLIVTAQGYQESRLNQSARSRAGAIGIMQLLPSTAADRNVGIPDITDAEANIHAGVRYLNFIRDRYFRDSGMDAFNQTLFALAAYNAGPARVAKLRNKAEQQGYDPNLWFDNVEIIAAREIGRETVQYVSNIVKYYVVYRLSIIRTLQRAEDRKLHGVGQKK
jgi:membrane-bound lytic murein transglycosylase MltF